MKQKEKINSIFENPDIEKEDLNNNSTKENIIENFGLNNYKLYRKFNIAFYHNLSLLLFISWCWLNLLKIIQIQEFLTVISCIPFMDSMLIFDLYKKYPILKNKLRDTWWNIKIMDKYFTTKRVCHRNLFKIACIELWYTDQCKEIFKKHWFSYLPKI